MKALRFALLLLIAAAPLVSASDWLNWRKAGDATLTWGPFTVYTSQLRTPQGRYIAADQDQALIITYARDITRDELVRPGYAPWQRSGRMSVRARNWRLFCTINKGSSGIALRRRKKPLPRWGHRNPWRSASAFWPSGSIPIRNTPGCVSSSLEVNNETHSGTWTDTSLNADGLQ